MKIRIVWSIASLFLIPGLVGCGNAPDAPARSETPVAPRTSDAATKRESFEGFSFERPNGWSRAAPDKDNTKAMLLLGGERSDVAKAMIKVDVGTPASRDPKVMAASLAQDFGGKVQPEPADLDGERGIQVLASSPNPGLSSKKALVAIRRGKVYLLMAGAVAGTDISDAFEQVRKSWKWDK